MKNEKVETKVETTEQTGEDLLQEYYQQDKHYMGQTYYVETHHEGGCC